MNNPFNQAGIVSLTADEFSHRFRFMMATVEKYHDVEPDSEIAHIIFEHLDRESGILAEDITHSIMSGDVKESNKKLKVIAQLTEKIAEQNNDSK